MTAKASPAGPMLSLDQVAMLLGLSKERVRQLVASGYLPRAGRNMYPLVATVWAYIKFLREDAARRAGSAADAELKAARQREVEVRTSERLGELVPAEEMMAVTQLIVGTLISRLDGLPAQFSRGPSDTRLAVAIDAIRTEIGGLIDDAARRYKMVGDV